MNYVDIIILIPLVWFTYKGFTKGFIIEIASLLALLGGIYVANHFSFYVADFLESKMDITNKYMSIISFVITFLLVIILVIFLGKMLEKVVTAAQLGLINKLAGALFGMIKVLFIVSVFFMMLSMFEIENLIIKEKTQEESLLYKPVKKIAPAVFPKFAEYKKSLVKPTENDSLPANSNTEN